MARRTEEQDFRQGGEPSAESTPRSRVEEFTSAAADRVQDATTAVGQQIESLAGTIRQNAPREGTLGTAAQQVAGWLDSGASYLREGNLRNAGKELTSFLRRYPLQAVLVGFGIGYLLKNRRSR